MNQEETKEIIKGLPPHLIGKGIQSTAQAQELGRKGGSVTGFTKTLGQKIRWLKQKGMCDENAQYFYEMIKNKELSYLKALQIIELMERKAETVKDYNLVSKCLNDWMKQVHGQKIEIAGDIHKEIDNSIHIAIEMWQPNGTEKDTNKLPTSPQTITVSPVNKEV